MGTDERGEEKKGGWALQVGPSGQGGGTNPPLLLTFLPRRRSEWPIMCWPTTSPSSAPQEFGVAHDVQAANIPFLCADLVYTYELLISGFGLGATQKMEVASLIDSIDTNWDPAETTWALGMVVDYLYNAPRPIAGGK